MPENDLRTHSDEVCASTRDPSVQRSGVAVRVLSGTPESFVERDASAFSSESFGLVLFVAGGASNWIDRVLRGSVVDFLNVGVGPLRTGVFNIADVAIMVGAGLVALGVFRREGGGVLRTPTNGTR